LLNVKASRNHPFKRKILKRFTFGSSAALFPPVTHQNMKHILTIRGIWNT